MWTYATCTGVVKIQYDSLTGKFVAYFNNLYLGRYSTPERAARALHGIAESSLFEDDGVTSVDVPLDLKKWQPSTHHVWF